MPWRDGWYHSAVSCVCVCLYRVLAMCWALNEGLWTIQQEPFSDCSGAHHYEPAFFYRVHDVHQDLPPEKILAFCLCWFEAAAAEALRKANPTYYEGLDKQTEQQARMKVLPTIPSRQRTLAIHVWKPVYKLNLLRGSSFSPTLLAGYSWSHLLQRLLLSVQPWAWTVLAETALRNSCLETGATFANQCPW